MATTGDEEKTMEFDNMKQDRFVNLVGHVKSRFELSWWMFELVSTEWGESDSSD